MTLQHSTTRSLQLTLAAAVAGVLVTPALSCDLCAVYSAIQARGESGKGFYAAAAEQFTHFGTLQLDGHKVPNDVNQSLDSSVTQLIAGYNFSGRLGVQLNLPIIHRSFVRPEGFEIDRGTVTGPGDVSLVATMVPYAYEEMDTTVRLSLLAGLKFPSGDTRRLAEELSEDETPGAPESGIHGHDLTLGTGSVDGIVGAGLFARSRRLFFTAGAQYAIRSTGDFDYRFANDLTWSGGPGAFLVLREKYTLALQAVVSGEYKARDTFQGATAEDTGVTAIYAGPQISFTWSDKLSAEAGVELPLAIRNTALQAVPDYRVRAGLTWHF